MKWVHDNIMTKMAALMSLLIIDISKVASITYTYAEGKGLLFAWQTDDLVGITAGIQDNGKTEQMAYFVSSTAQALPNDRTLYSIGYVLKPGMRYYAYYPYSHDALGSGMTLSLDYVWQTQRGNGSTAHLPLMDYALAETVTTSASGEFRFAHLGGVLRIEFVAPFAFSSADLNIYGDRAVLPTIARADLNSGQLYLMTTNRLFPVTLEDFNVRAGDLVTVYVTLPAVRLSGELLTLTLRTWGGANEYTFPRFYAPDIKRGMLYDIDLTLPVSRAAVQEAKTFPMPFAASATLRNPLVHADDILFDTSYKLTYEEKPPVTVVRDVEKRADEVAARYVTIDGKPVRRLRQGMVYKRVR